MKLIKRIIYLYLFLFHSFLFSVYVTSNFGKTHFIVGVDSAQVQQEKKVSRLKRKLEIPAETQHVAQVFFAPDDDTRAILLDLIACEQKSICMAAYLLTDVAVAKALVAAKERGVHVEFVTDKLCCGKYGKVQILLKNGIDVLVYKSKQAYGSRMSDIMHNKFIIFEKNILGRSLVWTGSFNFTNSARLNNQENILLLDNRSIIEKYVQQFSVLKDRSARYERSKFVKNDSFRRNKKRTHKRSNKKLARGKNHEARKKS